MFVNKFNEYLLRNGILEYWNTGIFHHSILPSSNTRPPKPPHTNVPIYQFTNSQFTTLLIYCSQLNIYYNIKEKNIQRKFTFLPVLFHV